MRESGDTEGLGGGRLLAAASLLSLAGLSCFSDTVAAFQQCLAPQGVVAAAVGARDGMTIRLTDGREVRLAGVGVPTDFDSADDAVRRATASLEALVSGRRLVLHAASRQPDRYGRLHVQAVAEDGQWIQQVLVRRGVAYAMPGSGDPECARHLLATEGAARASGEGFWKEEVLKVNRASEKLAVEGRFAVVEGIVRHVGESGGRIFLDFGGRFREDFTIAIPREAHIAFASSGMDLRGLSGRRVRARGMVFNRGGPAMELRVPAALELLGTDEG